MSRIFRACFSPQHTTINKSPSKDQFFTLKRRHKRFNSFKLSEFQPPSSYTAHIGTAKSLDGKEQYVSERIKKQNQLVSTFGSDNFLNFRSKPPKRKRKRVYQIKQSHICNVAEESQSQTEGSRVMLKDTAVRQKQVSTLKKQIIKGKVEWGIDDFDVLQRIGNGTYSEVFRARQKKTGFICSLKVLNKQKIRRLKVEQNILRQIKINLFMDHPNIVSLYGCFSDTNSLYLITQLASDNNLYQAMGQARAHGHKIIQVETVRSYVSQMCRAIHYMHENMIIHRDVKPQNMLKTFSDTIKLCDFGWSVHNPDQSLRSTFCGTPLYLAPQLVKQDSYSESVDLWALGIVTYEMITGELPFKIKSIRDLNKVITSEIDYSKVQDSLAVDFIRQLLRKEKQERKSIEEMIHHPFLTQPHT